MNDACIPLPLVPRVVTGAGRRVPEGANRPEIVAIRGRSLTRTIVALLVLFGLAVGITVSAAVVYAGADTGVAAVETATAGLLPNFGCQPQTGS